MLYRVEVCQNANCYATEAWASRTAAPLGSEEGSGDALGGLENTIGRKASGRKRKVSVMKSIEVEDDGVDSDDAPGPKKRIVAGGSVGGGVSDEAMAQLVAVVKTKRREYEEAVVAVGMAKARREMDAGEE